MKKNYFLLVAFLLAAFSYGQGSEDFANSAATSSYADGSFVGNGGVTWTYVASRAAVANTGGLPDAAQMPALMLRRSSSSSAILSSTISGGIADFSVKLYKQFTGSGNRQVELFINGVSVGTSTPFDDYDEHVFTVTGINVGGDFTIELKDITSKQVAIDDITWTAYAGAAVPAIAISAPTDGSTLSSGDFNISYVVSNFNIANGSADATQDGHVHWQMDGGTVNMVYDPTTADIAITDLAAGAHTLTMFLVDNSHVALTNPEATKTVNFTVQGYTQVADIATLRAGTIGVGYELTGEALINYEQSYRHQKYIQDATAGILIDDTAGNITAGNRGEGITAIKGVLATYKGMMQFVPALDATIVPTPSVTITAQTVTLADLATDFEDYEAELVKIVNVTMADQTGGDGNFANGKIFPMTQGSDNFNFRTNFHDADYIGEAVPTTAQDIVGLVSEKTGTGTTDYGQIFIARDLADFTATASVQENQIDGLAVYPNPATGNVLNIRTAANATKAINIYNVLGAKVFSTVSNNTQIALPALKAGIYVLNVVENGQNATVKLVLK